MVTTKLEGILMEALRAPTKKVNIIAECGVNFDNLETASNMIGRAKLAGADYVKFQLFNVSTIIDSPEYDRLRKLILSEEDVKYLQAIAENREIGFILTPMYLEAVDIAAKYSDYIKIRFKDHENQPLIDKALETGKTILISVPSKPIDALLYHPRIRYLYCLPSYPPEIEDFNLEIACSCHGFSSHYPHTVCDLAYVINRFYAECFIEKHVMLATKEIGIVATYADNTKETVATVEIANDPLDKAVSITFEELNCFVKQVKMIEKMKRLRL